MVGELYLNKVVMLKTRRHSRCDATGSAAAWECGDRFDPRPSKVDLALPQLLLSSRLQLGSDPWPGSSIRRGAAKDEKKNFFLKVYFLCQMPTFF